ncbi:uncharacterized protein LOC131596488 isoform X2 [Vicia villosa]|uniref:uncharacterized protein LOC131596488 isoform X2 n=1 Tax=Vicia villosa TaxID=3911 RepID=UPI00273AF7A9|nr:uncharacterized protein LOC131596488 isoform X2 [Vicia villosa]
MDPVTATCLLFTLTAGLLIFYIVSNLVSIATTDKNTTAKHHDQKPPVGPVLQRLAVQSPQTKSRVGFVKPVQLTITSTTTTSLETEDAIVNSDSEVDVELPPTKSNIDKTVAKVKSDSDVVEYLQETVVKSGDSTEEKSIEYVEETTGESSGEKLVSVVVNEGEENDDEDWEWEGIERSEVEKTFMEAVEFVAEKGYIGKCDDDLEMELYGLERVVIEGPCREPQPMPLKLSARAKWNAWQKLGNMSPEVAMEQYISLLSDKFPGWMKNTSTGMSEGEPSRSEVSESAAPDSSSALSHQQAILAERKLVRESKSGAQELIPYAESDSENNVKN